MSLSGSKHARRLALWATPVVLLALSITSGSLASDPFSNFERTYNPRGPAHLTISNLNGDIRVVAWDRRSVSVRARCSGNATIEDQTNRDDIIVSVKRSLRLPRVDFEVSAPPETSLEIKNFMGRIEARGFSGHLSISSVDSPVRLQDIRSQSVDVKVTSGDVFFDGELAEGGWYSLQSIKGDLDVTVPASNPFNLNARALSENINLGGFVKNLAVGSKGPKGIAGTYLNGGTKLTLTTYAGRILLHKR